MSDIQKNNFTRLLKEKGKTKRELSKFLEVHENGINRVLSNSNITLNRLREIAEFLEIDVLRLIRILYYPDSEMDTKAYDEPENSKPKIVSDSDNYSSLLLIEIIKGQELMKDNLNKINEQVSSLTKTLLNSQKKSE